MGLSEGPVQSPISQRFPDYMGRALVVTVNFNNSTRALIDCVVVREEGCLYRKLYWGLGPDGSPDSTPRQFTVPEGTGTTTITKGQFRGLGLETIEDLIAHQFTVGP